MSGAIQRLLGLEATLSRLVFREGEIPILDSLSRIPDDVWGLIFIECLKTVQLRADDCRPGSPPCVDVAVVQQIIDLPGVRRVDLNGCTITGREGDILRLGRNECLANGTVLLPGGRVFTRHVEGQSDPTGVSVWLAGDGACLDSITVSQARPLLTTRDEGSAVLVFPATESSRLRRGLGMSSVGNLLALVHEFRFFFQDFDQGSDPAHNREEDTRMRRCLASLEHHLEFLLRCYTSPPPPPLPLSDNDHVARCAGENTVFHIHDDVTDVIMDELLMGLSLKPDFDAAQGEGGAGDPFASSSSLAAAAADVAATAADLGVEPGHWRLLRHLLLEVYSQLCRAKYSVSETELRSGQIDIEHHLAEFHKRMGMSSEDYSTVVASLAALSSTPRLIQINEQGETPPPPPSSSSSPLGHDSDASNMVPGLTGGGESSIHNTSDSVPCVPQLQLSDWLVGMIIAGGLDGASCVPDVRWECEYDALLGVTRRRRRRLDAKPTTRISSSSSSKDVAAGTDEGEITMISSHGLPLLSPPTTMPSAHEQQLYLGLHILPRETDSRWLHMVRRAETGEPGGGDATTASSSSSAAREKERVGNTMAMKNPPSSLFSPHSVRVGLNRCTVQDNRSIGVVVWGVGVECVMEECAVTNNAAGVLVYEGAEVQMQRCRIENNNQGGILVGGKTCVGNSRATLDDCTCADNTGVGLVVAGKAQVTATNCTMSRTKKGHRDDRIFFTQSYGSGLIVLEGATVTLDRCYVEENGFGGIICDDGNLVCRLAHVCRNASWNCLALARAQVDLYQCTLTEQYDSGRDDGTGGGGGGVELSGGIICLHEGTFARVDGGLVGSNEGFGILAASGSLIQLLNGVRLMGNQEGSMLEAAGGQISADGVIDHAVVLDHESDHDDTSFEEHDAELYYQEEVDEARKDDDNYDEEP